MRKYRLERIRAELKRRDYAGALLYDPVNIRYATDSTNMQLWVAHNPTRHCFVATEGPVVLFDYFSCEHLSDHSGVVDEVRPAVSWMYLYGGELSDRRVARWAAGIADLVRAAWRRQQPHRGRPSRPGRRGRARPARRHRRQWRGGDGKRPADQIARRDPGHAPRHRRLRGGDGRDGGGAEPGISENELWAELHRGNIARGGEWIETRLLSSGPRTNPWFQECSVAQNRGGRPRRLRHRPDRPLRLLRRPFAHMALRRRRADATSSATCSASPPTRSPTTPS